MIKLFIKFIGFTQRISKRRLKFRFAGLIGLMAPLFTPLFVTFNRNGMSLRSKKCRIMFP